MLAMDNKGDISTVKIEDRESENTDTSEENKIYTEYPYRASMPVLKLENVIAGNPTANIADELDPGEIEEAEEAIDTAAVEESSPALEIKFHDKNYFQLYMHKVVKALKTALNVDKQQGHKCEFSIEDSAAENTTDKEQYLVKGFIVKNNRNEDQQQCSLVREESPDLDLASLFTIDTSGSKNLNTDAVPSYKRAINYYLDEDSIECKRKKQEMKTAACFNCGATDHLMHECPKPRNKMQINRSISAKKRYHIDVKEKLVHLRPGEISAKTRLAMRLKKGELPFFFYNMRKLGYPPGWLEEAKFVNSGISLFDSEGQAVNNSDNEDTNEEKYDASKIISFPGFNMDPGPKFFDNFEHHNVPPMNHGQMKKEFIKTLGDKVVKGYKLRKLKSLPSTSTVETESKADMQQIEEVDLNSESTATFCRPPLPATSSHEDTVLPPLPSTSPPESPVRELSQSMTLADLERKQKLLAEVTGEVTKADVPETENIIEECKSPSSDTLSTPIANGSKRCEDVKESHMGTPILQFSPFDKVPAGDNFKVGVSDVIHFQNLPHSTGKYKKMKRVIKKVRRVITKLQDDE